jgi:hypothetical protein
MLRWAWCGFHEKCTEKHYAEVVFLHPVESVGHVVHSDAFGARNVNAQIFMLMWDRYGFNKKASGHITPNLCFCMWWDLRVT